MSDIKLATTEQLIDVDMSKMAVIFMAPENLTDQFVEAGIKGDYEEHQHILTQMHIEVAKGNKRPNPPKALIKLFESMKNAQFKVNTDVDEEGEEHIRIEISDKDYVPIKGVKTESLLICAVTDVRNIDEENGTVTVGYDSSVGDKFVTVPIERVFPSKEKSRFPENLSDFDLTYKSSE